MPEPQTSYEEHVYHVTAPGDAEDILMPSGTGSCVPEALEVTVSRTGDDPLEVRAVIRGHYRDLSGSTKNAGVRLHPPGWNRGDWPQWVKEAVHGTVKRVKGL